MLSLVPILLVLAVLLADGGFVLELGLATSDSDVGRVAAMAVVPVVLVVVGAALVLAILDRQLGAGRALRSMVRTGDRCLLVARWLLLLYYLLQLLHLHLQNH